MIKNRIPKNRSKIICYIGSVVLMNITIFSFILSSILITTINLWYFSRLQFPSKSCRFCSLVASLWLSIQCVWIGSKYLIDVNCILIKFNAWFLTFCWYFSCTSSFEVDNSFRTGCLPLASKIFWRWPE